MEAAKASTGGEPAGIRTLDLLIKSQLLYRLSYRLATVTSLPETGPDRNPANGIRVRCSGVRIRKPLAFGIAESRGLFGRPAAVLDGHPVLSLAPGRFRLPFAAASGSFARDAPRKAGEDPPDGRGDPRALRGGSFNAPYLVPAPKMVILAALPAKFRVGPTLRGLRSLRFQGIPADS